MTDEHEPSGKDKPLVPATATGAAIIGIPLASILAAVGWAGQKVLDLDEITQRQQAVIEAREMRIVKLEEVAAQATIIRSTNQSVIENAKADVTKLEDRQLETMQRLSKVEQAIVDVRLSIQNLRDGDVQFLFDRLNLVEQKDADK